VIDKPAFRPQEFTNLPVSIPAILFGQPDQGQAQVVLGPGNSLIPQGAAGNPQNTAGTPFG
jgi:hypothetical protein